MTYVVTEAGKRLSLLDPDPSVIAWRDVCARLHRIRRYCGYPVGEDPGCVLAQAGLPAEWTVAQHSILVAQLLPPDFPEAIPYALLHDAHEGFLGDWIAPVKQVLAHDVSAWPRFDDGAVNQLERRIARAIHARAGLMFPASPMIAHAVMDADVLAFVTEVRHLIPPVMAAQFDLRDLPEPMGPEVIAAAARYPDAGAALEVALMRALALPVLAEVAS